MIKNSSVVHDIGKCNTIISDFDVDMLIFVRRNGMNKSEVAKLKLAGKISDITINLNPYTYSHLVNISRLFFPEAKKGEGGNPMAYKKLKKRAQFSGHLSKMRQTIKYFDKYYGILSSGYLFFFKAVGNEVFSKAN
jgi:hypothetical protein